MKYEIVELEEMTVAGLMVRTNNTSPDMSQKISGLWQQFFATGLFEEIPEKTGNTSIGLYKNYAGDEKDDYDFYVGCQVKPGVKMPAQSVSTTISKGKYAKFIVKGNMQTAVMDFWMKLWEMPLERKFDCDFEEYQPGEDMDNCEIHIYISLKE